MPQRFMSYQEASTRVHQLNPVVKLVWAGVVVLIAMLVEHPVVLSLLFLSTLPAVASARIWKQWAMIIQFALWMGILVVIINCLAGAGGNHILWQSGFRLPVLGRIEITLEAILFGLFMTVRLMAIISAFSVITLTIRPDDLLSALLEMRLPYKTAMMTALSIRFVPVLFEDASRIINAQRSRGLEMNKGSKLKRLKNRSMILPVLLSSSLERTIQLAEAMEARAFGSSGKRTRYFRINFSTKDTMSISMMLVLAAVVLFTLVTGLFSYNYYPSLQDPMLGTRGIIICVVLTVLLGGAIPLARADKGKPAV
ncbi:MAG: energy-coupling factor transporter transmembrane component T [Dehalococcoidales bacterium]|nr:energy-coupling factor transporter transmembrane component T [Dehalococcoidales bacterium]